MGTFINENGFIKKTLVEIKAELEAEFKAIFGNDIDLDPTGSFGQLIGLLAKRDADLWDGAEEIYTSRNPNEATGTSLDNVAAENAIERLQATKTTIQNAFLLGTEGTLIVAGKKVRQSIPVTSPDLTLDADVTIAITSGNYVKLSLDDPSAGGIVYTVTIDGIAYTDTSSASDTKKIVIDNLVALITAGAFTGTAENVGDEFLLITNLLSSFSTVFTTTLVLEVQGNTGDFTAVETGSYAMPSGTVNTIVTPVSGWSSILNTTAGATGSPRETDSAFRIRREQSINKGYSTDDAIRAKLLDEVDNISSATVTSNRTSSVDSDGRPSKSFEAVVVGGTDQDVADKIWETMPSGIEPYGNTLVTVVDSEGISQDVYFSRSVTLYIWVNIVRSDYSGEVFPADGNDLIKEAIVEWALENQPIGKDVIAQRLSIPIYSIPGTDSITITIASTATPGGTPSYGASDIAVNSREIAEFDISRITVTP